MRTGSGFPYFYLICLLTPAIIIFLALLIGPLPAKSGSIWDALSSLMQPTTELPENLRVFNNILLNIRIPRILLAFLVGASLAVSGTVLQSIFRNPLVDSYMLGISSGAAFGVSLAIVFSWPIYLLAFIWGLISVALTYAVGFVRQGSMLAIVLAGIVISGLFTALLSVVQFLSNPYKLQAIVQWTLGNLNSASWLEIKQVALPILLSLIITYIFSWRLNVLALGDEAMRAIGANPRRDKLIFILCASVMTASAVAAIGIVSMFGLLVPHMVRMLFGADNRKLVLGSCCLGGSFLVLIDLCARAFWQFEIPVGIITILLGAPCFLYLMRTRKLNWQ